MSVMILVIWLTLLPVLVGSLLGAGLGHWKKNPLFLWVTGQVCLWALFQLICVPFILLQREFSQIVVLYAGACGALAVLALVLGLGRQKKPLWKGAVVREEKEREKWQLCLWVLFFLILAFQLLQTVRLAYSDGDDAFYVAVATVAEESDRMYEVLPYTGGATGLDARHGLAPFPIWIAFLARISGIPVVSVAHVIVPQLSLLMVYGIFYLAGSRLFGRGGEKLPVFMVLTELLFLFGDCSPYTVEKFLLTRSRQGKAALAGIILPFLIFLFLLLLDRLQEGQKVEWSLWCLLSAAVTAGCLCSTQGAELCGLLVVVLGLCAAFSYHRWKLWLPMALGCVPAACYAGLYFILR